MGGTPSVHIGEINVSGGSGSPEEIADSIADVIERRLATQHYDARSTIHGDVY